MSNPKQPWLIRYSYDPLDRLTSHARSDTPERHRFYCKNRLATEIQGAIGHSIVQYSDFLLAQQQRQHDAHDTTLLATDLQCSVVNTLKKNTERQSIAYSPYGHRLAESGLTSLLGFNGERPDPVTRHYLLGNGYRAFNPALMRFNSPDSLSPFGKGGFNSYAYCKGDPVNFSDPTGHTLKLNQNFLQRITNKIITKAIKKINSTINKAIDAKINKDIDILISKLYSDRRTSDELISIKIIKEQKELVNKRHPRIDPPENKTRRTFEELIEDFHQNRKAIKPNTTRNLFLQELNNNSSIYNNRVPDKLFEHSIYSGERMQDFTNSPLYINAKETNSQLIKIAKQIENSAIPFDRVIENAMDQIRRS